MPTAVKVGLRREGTQQGGTWVRGFSSGEWPKSIRSSLKLSPPLNPTRIKSTSLAFIFSLPRVFLGCTRMNGRTEVKGVARCLAKEVIMRGFSSLATLDQYVPDLNVKGGMYTVAQFVISC